MRVLLDECVPRRVRRSLPGHHVSTVSRMGWSGKTNGELLSLMAGAGVQVFLTVDRNLRYQQNLRKTGIALVVMLSRSNGPSDLVPLMPKVLAVLDTIQPGEVIEVDASGPRQTNQP